MNYYPDLQEINHISKTGKYKILPVYTEVYCDTITPIQLLKKLKQRSEHCFILESAEDNKHFGRYTILSFQPQMEITCINNNVTKKFINGETITYNTHNPNETIREVLKENKSPKLNNLPSFTGGLVGYFAYDYIKYAEPTLNLVEDETKEFMDMDLMLFDKVFVYDNYLGKIYVICNIHLEDKNKENKNNIEDKETKNSLEEDFIHKEYERAKDEINNLINIIYSPDDNTPLSGKIKSDFKYLFSKAEYENLVVQGKKHIYEGDIFQVVLSNKMEAEFEGSLFDTYRILRTTNRSPYMFYLSSDSQEIVGSSPETLVKLKDATIYTYPLAGTRKRGNNIDEDELLKEELLSDEKEIAEHNMLVDLGRNDLGRICKINTVKVEKYMNVEMYSHVMHIGSTVSGEICDNKDGLDGIVSVLPAGTLSGAPKIKACEIINKLENNRRGIYGGAIGYLDFTGNMDTCIGIRLAYKKNNKVYIRSGAGIVADSIPENEYLECINKAKAVVNAINQASVKGDELNGYINR